MMLEMVGFLVIGALVVLLVVVLAFATRGGRKKALDAVRELAESRGWSFTVGPAHKKWTITGSLSGVRFDAECSRPQRHVGSTQASRPFDTRLTAAVPGGGVLVEPVGFSKLPAFVRKGLAQTFGPNADSIRTSGSRLETLPTASKLPKRLDVWETTPGIAVKLLTEDVIAALERFVGSSSPPVITWFDGTLQIVVGGNNTRAVDEKTFFELAGAITEAARKG
ncbi:MAG: hypothetical protein EA426_19260 [Spirochaetaceae bacterium]|nr:MAG: hypothetical protein EA426_19260 [Spirochaetaceae bacterium]